jgi:hypothetical protein
MVSLADGKITPLPNMRSYRLPEASGKWMVYATAADSATNDSTRAGAGTGRAGRGGGARAGQRRTYGNPITLRHLDTGADEVIADVVAYQFDDSAKVLAYTVASRADSTKDGVYLRNVVTGATQNVLSGPGNYRAFAFDRLQQQFVFTTDRDDFGKPNARQVIYLGSVKTGAAQPVVRSEMLPEGMRFPDSFNVTLNRAGTALQFAIAPPPEDTVPADSLVGKARYDLWHWKDPALQPTQKDRRAVDRCALRRTTDVGGRRERRLSRRPGHRFAEAGCDEDLGQRAALARRQVHRVFRPERVAHLQRGNRQGHQHHGLHAERAFRARDAQHAR